MLKVRPPSVGARPGPTFYGLGGRDVTVSDAYVTLGIIEPRKFLGGSVPLDPALAERTAAALGQRLGKSMVEAAESVGEGPRVIEQYAATVLVPAGFSVRADELGSLIGGATHGDR